MFLLMFIIFYLISLLFIFFFFFNDTATTEIYTLSLHDALPICADGRLAVERLRRPGQAHTWAEVLGIGIVIRRRSEEHTSELQSHSDLVCRLLLEKKKKKNKKQKTTQIHKK